MTISPFPRRSSRRVPRKGNPVAEQFDGTGVRARIVALIAAHNEEVSIGAALESLAVQGRRPDEVIVVADRCTDRTAEIAASYGAKVFETLDNGHRKAGALNQALVNVLADLKPTDQVLLMDADTILSEGFVGSAESRLNSRNAGRSPVGAVGGVFFAHDRR